MRRWTSVAIVAASLLLANQVAAADPPREFTVAVKALERGSFEEAIDALETLADQGFVHPDASYNRGLAYVARARSPQRRPGDLGRAAAAFSESRLWRPDDRDAELALETVRSEIARLRVRQGAEPVAARPSLWRAVVGLGSEGTYAVLGLVGSGLLTLGLGLRLVGARRPLRLAGAVLLALGCLLMVVGGGWASPRPGSGPRRSRPWSWPARRGCSISRVFQSGRLLGRPSTWRFRRERPSRCSRSRRVGRTSSGAACARG